MKYLNTLFSKRENMNTKNITVLFILGITLTIQALNQNQQSKPQPTQQPTKNNNLPTMNQEPISQFSNYINNMKKYMTSKDSKNFKKSAEDARKALHEIKAAKKDHTMSKTQYEQFSASAKELHQMRLALDKAKANKKKQSSQQTPH